MKDGHPPSQAVLWLVFSNARQFPLFFVLLFLTSSRSAQTGARAGGFIPDARLSPIRTGCLGGDRGEHPADRNTAARASCVADEMPHCDPVRLSQRCENLLPHS